MGKQWAEVGEQWAVGEMWVNSGRRVGDNWVRSEKYMSYSCDECIKMFAT